MTSTMQPRDFQNSDTISIDWRTGFFRMRDDASGAIEQIVAGVFDTLLFAAGDRVRTDISDCFAESCVRPIGAGIRLVEPTSVTMAPDLAYLRISKNMVFKQTNRRGQYDQVGVLHAGF